MTSNEDGNCVRYGVPFKLRHLATGKLLHSHVNGFSSDYIQEVGCFDSSDNNGWWVVKGPAGTNLWNCLIGQPVLNNSVIRLLHLCTGKYLRSQHWRWSPLSYNQEVVCDGGYESTDDSDNWRIVIEGVENNEIWNKDHTVSVIHVNTEHRLHSNQRVFPDSKLQEVCGHTGKDYNDYWRVELVF